MVTVLRVLEVYEDVDVDRHEHDGGDDRHQDEEPVVPVGRHGGTRRSESSTRAGSFAFSLSRGAAYSAGLSARSEPSVVFDRSFVRRCFVVGASLRGPGLRAPEHCPKTELTHFEMCESGNGKTGLREEEEQPRDSLVGAPGHSTCRGPRR